MKPTLISLMIPLTILLFVVNNNNMAAASPLLNNQHFRPYANNSLEWFYNERIRRHVDLIIDRIAEFNPESSSSSSLARKDSFADYDEMQGDQPDEQKANANEAQRAAVREDDDRDKEAMRTQIKQWVMQMTGRSNATSSPPPLLTRSNAERIRSYYPLCDMNTTKSSEEETNEDSSSNLLMRLHFGTGQLEGMVESGTLRLHRRGVNVTTDTTSNTVDNEIPCRTNRNIDEKVFRVSVYFTAKNPSSKKHKSVVLDAKHRKLCDSRVIGETAKLVDLNVLASLRGDWFKVGGSKVIKFAVQVEDQFGATIKAHDFFHGPSCTVGMSTPQPVPTIVEEQRHPGLVGADATSAFALSRAVFYPQLDIKTSEHPSSPSSSPVHTTASKGNHLCRHHTIRHGGHSHAKRAQTTTTTASIGNADEDGSAVFQHFSQNMQNQQTIVDPAHVQRLLSTFNRQKREKV